jgi:hypothetical protein
MSFRIRLARAPPVGEDGGGERSITECVIEETVPEDVVCEADGG